MPIIIDGHNLIPNIPGLNLSNIDDEDQLIEILLAYQRKSRKGIEVFFDNAPPGFAGSKKFGRLTAYYIRKGSTADQAIHNRLRKLGKSARNWIVVSSDNEVRNMAEMMRATVVSSVEFAQEISRSPRRESDEHVEKENLGEPSPAEVQKWLKLFGE